MYRRDQIVEFILKRLSEKNFRKYQRYVVGGKAPTKRYNDERDAYIRDFEKASKVANRHTSIYVPCTSEQEVIALFYDLLGRKTLLGYQTMMLSQFRTYDALVRYHVKPEKATLYKEESNPLGIITDVFDSERTHEILIDKALVEFKLTLDELYTDLWTVGHNKDQGEIDLLVCWSAKQTVAAKRGDSLTPLLPSQRVFFGATHELTVSSSAKPLQVMALQDVLVAIEKVTPG